MTAPGDERSERLVAQRAELLPEEEAPGSEAPLAQAEAILEDSERRTLDPEGTQRASSQTPDARDG